MKRTGEQGGQKLSLAGAKRGQQQLRKERSAREVRSRLLKMIVDNEQERRREIFPSVVQR